MKWIEYGKDCKDTIVMLHGGGLNWWNFRKEAELLQNQYHVVLPVLDGHAGSDAPFTTMEDNASRIIDYIDQNCGGSVLMIAGLSLGAQIALEILSKRKDICKYALIESAAVIPSKITNAMIGPAFGSSYGLIKNKSFAKLQFKSLRIRQDLFEDYYRDTCGIQKSNMIAFMKANTSYMLRDSMKEIQAEVHIYAGEKENREIMESAKEIQKAVPHSRLHILKGLYHGEFSLNHPDEYVKEVETILK